MIVNKKWISDNYKKFNKMYFNNELPKIKFRTSSAKSYLGLASARYDDITGSTTDFSITISNYWDQPEDVKMSTLLHEMIHIKDYVVNGKEIYLSAWSKGKRRGHGEFFLKEAKRISDLSGIDITVRATREDMDRSKYSLKTEQRMSADYQALISKDRGYVMFRLPKNYDASDVSHIMNEFGLYECNVIEGNFKIYAEKRGSVKSGKIIGDKRYDITMAESKKISPVLYRTDGIYDLNVKLNEIK